RLAAELEAALGRGATEPSRALGALEEALVAADVGVRTSAELVARVRTRVGRSASVAEIRQALQEEVEAVLGVVAEPTPTACPWVVLVAGVNGVGKTTTIGKLAARHAAAGRSVLLVAGDTFRAAAIDQLAVWAARAGAAIAIREQTGLPIRYLGVGEGTEDLRPFEAHQFARALLEPDVPAAERARFA